MNDDIENITEAYRALKRIHITANETNEKQLDEINKLRQENVFLKTQLVNSESSINIQKMIAANTIQSSQEKHERDYDEILKLKNEIRELKITLKPSGM